MRENWRLFLVDGYRSFLRLASRKATDGQPRVLLQVCVLIIVSSLHFSPLPYTSFAQETQTNPAIDKVKLHQALLDLNNPFTVMCVAAHPDDEDGTTLTVLRRKYGIHTVSLFSTYGEGGQNAVGPELYEELGVIRASETERAAAIQGSEPHFLGLKDFGFSKSAEEALRIWGHDEALRRMVWEIRKLRPDVIITNHDTTGGHGHHQATGRLVLEAFDAAANPQSFPEQLQHVSTWQPKRLFVRVRRAAAAEEHLVIIDPNEIDPVRGTSFGEQALTALQQHASQGPWPKSVSDWLRAQNNQGGRLSLVRYRLAREAVVTDGIAEVPSRIPFLGGLKLPEQFWGASAFSGEDPPPEKHSAEITDTALSALDNWQTAVLHSSNFKAAQKRIELIESIWHRALATVSAASLSLASAEPILVPGTNNKYSVTVTNKSSKTLGIQRLTLHAWGRKMNLEAADKLLPDTDTTLTVDLATPKIATVSVPKPEHLYDGLLKGAPVVAEAEVEFEGARFILRNEINLDVAPAVEIRNITPLPYVWTPGTTNKPIVFSIDVRNNTSEAFRGAVKITSPALRVFAFGQALSLEAHESREVRLEMTPALGRRATQRSIAGMPTVISVEEPETRRMVTSRVVAVRYSDAIVARDLRVGYVPSFDHTLENSLAALGVAAQMLTETKLSAETLADLDAVIIDNRGYEAHPWLVAANEKLMQFVRDGGTLLVFYHKDNEWNPDEKRNRPQLAPLPILLGGERITEEDAPVHFRHPRHPLLNFPNRITQADFGDWVQERGLYYPKEWDPQYTMLFSSHDTGEKPLYGGLLVAPYGKGHYMFTSMVWYRQLRAGLPGAYRMFANMISYGKKG
jgi:LmbE family N-acetylglucosaminyl deacetylase